MKKILSFSLVFLVCLFGISMADETFNFGQDRFYSPNPSRISVATTTYSILTTDHMIKGDASSAAFTMTLPAIKSNGLAGKSYIINKIDTTLNAITVAPSTSDTATNTIEGKTTRVLMVPSGYMVLKAIGTDWKVTYETPPYDTDMTTGEFSTYKSRIGLGLVTTPTTSTTLTQSDCGKTIAVATDSLTITLPTAIAGCGFNFINTGAAANNILDVKAGSADAFYGVLWNPGAGTSTIVSSSTGSTLSNTKATSQKGSFASIFSPAAATWIVTRNTGTWTTK